MPRDRHRLQGKKDTHNRFNGLMKDDTPSTNRTRNAGPTTAHRSPRAAIVPSRGLVERGLDVFTVGALALALALAPAEADEGAIDADEGEPPVERRAELRQAQPPQDDLDTRLFGDPVTEELADPGSLLFETEHKGLYLPAPQLDTEIHVRVTGIVVRTEVVQRFHNPTEWWVEGLYLFPLPETASVDSLEMRIGERVVVGEIQEREEAQKRYEAARSSGRRASLVRQDRPNVFRTAVANIGPAETIEISIEFQQIAAFDGEHFELRIPTVVAPRYYGSSSPRLAALEILEEPLTPMTLCGIEGEATWSEIAFASLTAANSPSLRGATAVDTSSARTHARPRSDFELTIDLEPGFPIASIDSLYHSVETFEIERGRFGIGVIGSSAVANRDFALTWTPALDRLPQATVLAEEFEGELYALLMLLPPDETTGADLDLPRETVFVIDTSGSMSGDSLHQAQEALRFALRSLGPEDSFNIIRFDSDTEALFPQAVPASASTLTEADRFVSALRADGGTEMLPALEFALGTETGLYPVRQVIFITDGSIGNEASLFAEIDQRLGESRLFTVGIGSAPNSHFMRKAAEIGRGTFTYIGSPHEVEVKMSGLFDKLAHPVLSDLEIEWPDPATEAWPERLPDLYRGEPLVVTARMSDGRALEGLGSLEIRGRRGPTIWDAALALPKAAGRHGIHKLWARQRLGSLMDRHSTGGDPDAIRDEVVTTALRHHLVSRYTSLIAVDRTPAAHTSGEPVQTQPIPLALPAGWKPPFVVGDLPQTGTLAPLLLLLGFAALAGGSLLLLPTLRGGSG